MLVCWRTIEFTRVFYRLNYAMIVLLSTNTNLVVVIGMFRVQFCMPTTWAVPFIVLDVRDDNWSIFAFNSLTVDTVGWASG